MNQLSSRQHELVLSLADRLGAIEGVRAVVLGGSHARGRARPDSDIDLGLFYSDASPFSIEEIRDLARAVNDEEEPVVSDFYGWGQWVNGGAWLTIGGQRVDLVYRSLEQVERVIAEAKAGRHQLDYDQQPPFGFHSSTYLGEIEICVPLSDPESRVDRLKRQVADYPEELRRVLIQEYLWAAEFNLAAFAGKFAARNDAYGATACLARVVNQLILVLFALNRRYLVNDKTALEEIAEFVLAPAEFTARVQRIFAHPGDSSSDLSEVVGLTLELWSDTVKLASGIYQPRYDLSTSL